MWNKKIFEVGDGLVPPGLESLRFVKLRQDNMIFI
jgi:hypothetical protein